MSTTTQPRQTASTTRQPFVARFPLWLVTVSALVVAAVATAAYGLVVRAAGLDFAAAGPGASPVEITASGLLTTVLIEGSPGIVLALAFARWARRPRSTWKRTTWTLTAVSFVPIVIAEASFASQVALGGAHLVAASIVILTVAARLADTNARRA